MSTGQEIERAIEKLSDEEVQELRAWLFDREIARDSLTGLLDSFAAGAISDARGGRVKPL